MNKTVNFEIPKGEQITIRHEAIPDQSSSGSPSLFVTVILIYLLLILVGMLQGPSTVQEQIPAQPLPQNPPAETLPYTPGQPL